MNWNWLFRRKKRIDNMRRPDRFQNGVFGPLIVDDKKTGRKRVVTDDEYRLLLEETT